MRPCTAKMGGRSSIKGRPLDDAPRPGPAEGAAVTALQHPRVGVTFDQCVWVAYGTPDLLREFDRLNGTNLSGRGAPIELAIDEASGRLHDDLRRFVEFVDEYVWQRLPPEARAEPRP